MLQAGKAEEAELLRFPVSRFSAVFSAGGGGAGAGGGADVDVGDADAGDGGGGVDAGGAADGGGGGGGGANEMSLNEKRAKADRREIQRMMDVARDLSQRGLLVSVRCVLCSLGTAVCA